jgi:exopolysaccharide production protein ExoZ
VVGGGRDQLISIQILRGLAALAVALCHASAYIVSVDPHTTVPYVSVGAAGVDVFFVISGFVIVYSSEDLFQRPNGQEVFLFRRIARVVPLYWIVTSFWLCSLLYLGNTHDIAQTLRNDDLSWPNIFASFLFLPYPRANSGVYVPSLAVGWTLNYEMLFYLLFAGAIALRRGTAVISVALVLIGLAVLRNIIIPVPPSAPLTAHGLLNWLLVSYQEMIIEFVYGMLIALAYRAGWRLPKAVCVLLLAASFAIFVWSDINPAILIKLPRQFLWGGAGAAIVGALVLSKDKAPDLLPVRFFVLLGAASYALYLTHPVAQALICDYNLAFRSLAAAYPWSCLFFLMALSAAVGVAVYLFLERPMTRRLQSKIRVRSQRAERRRMQDALATPFDDNSDQVAQTPRV